LGKASTRNPLHPQKVKAEIASHPQPVKTVVAKLEEEFGFADAPRYFKAVLKGFKTLNGMRNISPRDVASACVIPHE